MRQRHLEDLSTANTAEPAAREPGEWLVPALTVVSHPMAHRVGERVLLEALSAGREVALSRNVPDFLAPGAALGTPLLDPYLSRKPLVLAPGPQGRIRLEPGPSSRVTLGGKPLQGPWELSPEEVAAGVPLELAGRVVVLLHLAEPGPLGPVGALGMVGTSTGLQRVRHHLLQVADLDVPVLIRGETGSGRLRG
jgi:two-component system, NtrC family, nitrogen regulation response regulator GlnG